MRTYSRNCVNDYPVSPCAQIEACYRGKASIVFTNGNLGKVQTILESNAPPSIGAIVPKDPIE